jgi:hypothetical protein
VWKRMVVVVERMVTTVSTSIKDLSAVPDQVSTATRSGSCLSKPWLSEGITLLISVQSVSTYAGSSLATRAAPLDGEGGSDFGSGPKWYVGRMDVCFMRAHAICTSGRCRARYASTSETISAGDES